MESNYEASFMNVDNGYWSFQMKLHVKGGSYEALAQRSKQVCN